MGSEILESWCANARQWVETLANHELESRQLVTEQAILQAVLVQHPQIVLDAGCGEGWLCRSLQSQHIETFGIDGSPELIHEARLKGPGHFEVMSFEEMNRQEVLTGMPYCAVVFNFCLYDDHETETLLHNAIHWVKPRGKLFIQTLHPFQVLKNNEPYCDGWRLETWSGLIRRFTHPYYWYYRTIGGWLKVVDSAGWRLDSLHEPIHPASRQPVSLILIASKKSINHP